MFHLSLHLIPHTHTHTHSSLLFFFAHYILSCTMFLENTQKGITRKGFTYQHHANTKEKSERKILVKAMYRCGCVLKLNYFCGQSNEKERKKSKPKSSSAQKKGKLETERKKKDIIFINVKEEKRRKSMPTLTTDRTTVKVLKHVGIFSLCVCVRFFKKCWKVKMSNSLVKDSICCIFFSFYINRCSTVCYILSDSLL